MSKNRNRAKLNKAHNSREYTNIWNNILYPTYWDEGMYFHPAYRKGYKNPNKRIPMFKAREYKTWKYNRKTQWRGSSVG